MTTSFHHIDPNRLLASIGGDRATMLHLFGMFLRATPRARDAMAEAIAADERDKARRLAHEMRGNVVIFGATELAGTLSQLEQSLHEGPAPAELAQRCLVMIDAVCAEMSAAVADEAEHVQPESATPPE
jgi:two-component system sensor histidine kinase/response regulator